MLIRADLKQEAKSALQGNWFNAVLVSFIAMVMTSGPSAIPAIGWIVSIILAGPVTVGLYGYFIKLLKKENPQLDNLFEGFSMFAKALKLYLWYILFIILWVLLFIIPGIIKSIAYSMSFMILKENPDMNARDVLKESMRLTEGYKWQLFVLSLSFLGWAIVCVFTLGIGFLWLMPYCTATYTAAYNKLKELKGSATATPAA